MTIQLRRDTAANWTAANPTLAAGQPGLETDTNKLKFGNGVNAWNSLPYFSSGLPGGSSGEVQYNNAGVMAGAADIEVEGGQLRLPSIATPTAPAAGGVKLYGKTYTGKPLLTMLGPNGLEAAIQSHLARNNVSIFKACGNATLATSNLGYANNATGTVTIANVAITNRYTKTRLIEYLVTVAATNAVAGMRGVGQQIWRGNAAGEGGFFMVMRWGPATGVSTSTTRAFAGLRASSNAPTDVNPSTLTNIIGMGWDAADTNVQLMANDSVGTATKIDLGASFPKPTVDRTTIYEITLFAAPNDTTIYYEVTDMTTGAVTSGSTSTDLPQNTALLNTYSYMSVGGTSSVIGIGISSIYVETDY